MRYTALASDYDETIAEDGVVSQATVAALRRFRNAGGELFLVTGREVLDLQNIFPELALFHWIVAENGAILYETASGEETVLASAPNQQLLTTLREKNVTPLYIGRVIVATYVHHVAEITQVIRELQLDMQVIPNKGSAMILPLGCDKASGLRKLFTKTGGSAETTVGVGDGENDIPLLKICGLGVAVSNALPSLKEKADWVTTKPAGEGVAELINRLLSAEQF